MPIVPGDPFVPSVMPQGQMITNTIDRASPDAFGGQAGQTLQQTGDMLQQHSIRRQQFANETAVQDVYANQFSPQLRTITQNYMNLEGKDAETAFPQFQQQINDLRNETREILNPYQQRLFDQRSTRRVEGDLDGMARYAASQTKQWEWNTHNAVLSDLIAEAEAYYNDPRRVAAVVGQVDNETANYANSHGWSDEVYEYQLHKNNDMLWSAVIKRQALFDPAGAMATYQDAAAKKRISGSAQGELENFLKPIQDLESAQDAYEQVTGGAMAQAIAEEAQRQGVDPSTALTIWSAEGGITNPAAKNPSSSAAGIFQHTSGTWFDLGGTDQDRLDASRQVQLGVALTRQNTAALAKELGRQPQPWELYLAHQQGMDGATALLHADPNANAGDVVGNLKAITQNGGAPDTTAGQFINTIKGYVDRHSMMYAPNGAPTAQNLKENYEVGLQAVTDLARQEHPSDPGAEERYRSHYIQQAGQLLHAEQETNQANWNIVNAALNGPNAIKSEQDLLTNPRLIDAYNAILKTDPSAYKVVNNAVNANALAMWDPPATAQTNQLYDTLNGMKDADREQFKNVNLMSYYGGMPVAQLNSLMGAQNRIRNNDPTEAAKHANLISSISAVNDLTTLAAASAESPFYKMDDASPFPPEQQKWNGFVSKYGQALDDWQQNNNGKIPTDMQKREIAQGILFPKGMPTPLGVAAEGNPNFSESNTGTNANSDTNVLESNGKPDQPRVTEVLTFDPVGHLKSSFGHTAININGTTYAFTEKGWNKGEETAKYFARNHFRNAVGQELDLTPEEQDLLVKVIKQDMADNPKWSSQNSCVTKIRDALEQATGRMFGIPPRPPIIGPLDFRDNLDRFGYVVKKNLYPSQP